MLDAREPGVGHHRARLFGAPRPCRACPASAGRRRRSRGWSSTGRARRSGTRRCGPTTGSAFGFSVLHSTSPSSRMRPGRDLVKSGDGVEQRRLAAARRADDHADLAGVDVERAVIDRHHRGAVRIVDLDDVVDDDRAARRGRTRAARAVVAAAIIVLRGRARACATASGSRPPCAPSRSSRSRRRPA